MADKAYDVLVIGATGYTGRLITEYLANHSSSSSLRVAVGGRTLTKVQELASKYNNVGSLYVDVNEEQSVMDAVAKTRVVINIAGPYWTRGSVVVKACAKNGVHYLDLTGEGPFVAKVVQDYDYLAYKNRAVIVTCSGYDSIPSDLAAYLAVQTLERQLSLLGVDALNIKSTAAHTVKGGLSGGTAATFMSAFEEVPRDKLKTGRGWGLSPVHGQPGYSSLPKLLYSLPHTEPQIYGGYFPMASINEAIVRRSWGLRERFRRESKPGSPYSRFSYSEFLKTPSPISGIMFSVAVFMTAAAIALLPPVRWLAKMFLPKSGEGPAPDKLDKGRFEVVNISEGAGVVVKSTVRGDGDPGYRLTSIMIVESALLLLDPSNLTPLGRQGGILTPSTAFGDRLVQALEATGRFKTSVEVLESRKTR